MLIENYLILLMAALPIIVVIAVIGFILYVWSIYSDSWGHRHERG